MTFGTGSSIDSVRASAVNMVDRARVAVTRHVIVRGVLCAVAAGMVAFPVPAFSVHTDERRGLRDRYPSVARPANTFSEKECGTCVGIVASGATDRRVVLMLLFVRQRSKVFVHSFPPGALSFRIRHSDSSEVKLALIFWLYFQVFPIEAVGQSISSLS